MFKSVEAQPKGKQETYEVAELEPLCSKGSLRELLFRGHSSVLSRDGADKEGEESGITSDRNHNSKKDRRSISRGGTGWLRKEEEEAWGSQLPEAVDYLLKGRGVVMALFSQHPPNTLPSWQG
jgi:hypothetical protein